MNTPCHKKRVLENNEKWKVGGGVGVRGERVIFMREVTARLVFFRFSFIFSKSYTHLS